MDYTLIRSDRKTVGFEINENGLIVRAPRRMPKAQIDRLIEKDRERIEKHIGKFADRRKNLEGVSRLAPNEITALAQKARGYIPERVKYYAEKLGVEYGNITIRAQKTRWGSCSAKRNLNFNCALMLAPVEVIDSVVVHELCHMIEPNHSKAFYDCIYKVFPDYDNCRKWLKENGDRLIKQISG